MAIVDAEAAQRVGWTMTDLASAYLNGGATLLQVRAKAAPGGRLLDIVSDIVALARRASARVIVNDRADIARMSGAAGVHVGQDDLEPSLVRSIVGDDAVIGLSTHTPAQLDAAVRQPISYVAIGPIFGTETKRTGYESLGLAAVTRAAVHARAAGLPLIAIGGVTLETAPQVISAGANAVAVIGDLAQAADPAARVRAYLSRLTV